MRYWKSSTAFDDLFFFFCLSFRFFFHGQGSYAVVGDGNNLGMFFAFICIMLFISFLTISFAELYHSSFLLFFIGSPVQMEQGIVLSPVHSYFSLIQHFPLHD
ncbi:hypothetical protein J3459_006392 [Metarhizium acridum]|nr:hypothetical protein J3459_006392 [Metarhizium acridum]